MVKMLTVLISTISNSQVFLLLKKCEYFSKCKSYSHFFSKNISTYATFNDQSFNDMLTKDIVSFEQLGPVLLIYLANSCYFQCNYVHRSNHLSQIWPGAVSADRNPLCCFLGSDSGRTTYIYYTVNSSLKLAYLE